MQKEGRHTWGPKARERKHVAAYHHSGITVVTRQATERETDKRERKRERERERELRKERKRAQKREREKERERVAYRKRGDTHGDQKRGKESMSQRTITVVSQW